MQSISTLRFTGLFTLFCLFMSAQKLQAQATLSIQGIIQKSNGAAVDDGTYDLTFKLYPTTSGGTAVHTETQNISVVGGIYSAELGGSGTPLSAAFDQTYYLGVSVDGGAELVPRTRLTSSPYALSLLGTENLFSSAGTVGIGTVTPHTSYKLHVRNASGGGKLLLDGSTAALLDFRKGSTVASIGFGSANNDFVLNPGANNTTLQYNSSTKLTVNNDGVNVAGTLNATTITASTITGAYSPATMAVTSRLAVGQSSVDANNALRVVGNTLLSGFLEITGSRNIDYGQAYYFTTLPTIQFAPAGARDYGIKSQFSVSAPAYFVNSDTRIKKDLRLSEKSKDLNILNQLRVTDYRHIDHVAYGTNSVKGLIAQEVERVFPEAVNTSSNFIPSIYGFSAKTAFSSGRLSVSLPQKHELVVGDEVKLILKDAGEKTAIVAAVDSENTFLINWDEAAAAPERVFVYGKKVNDFHTVDYDRIFTLNVSATQELARKVELLEKENAALKSENKEMKASAEKFDARLRALENKLSN